MPGLAGNSHAIMTVDAPDHAILEPASSDAKRLKMLFTFENPLPSKEADAEVFMTTASYLASRIFKAWLHVPQAHDTNSDDASASSGLKLLRARAPLRPAALRHFCCGVTLVFKKEFRDADVIYTRNLWIAWMATLFGQRVVFDHYRPWSDQIPPLQHWIYRLMCRKSFLVNICHSNYTRQKYLALGIPPEKVVCVRNGFEPQRLQSPVPVDAAKRAIGLSDTRKTVVYTGRLNHRKGLSLVIEAAKELPDILFILVGSYGNGPIEALAAGIENILVIPWQPADVIGQYVFAADVLLIPPSWKPLAQFGSTVLPLKLFFYMASGRPICAGNTPDVSEVLHHDRNAFLCVPDKLDSLIDGIRTLTSDAGLADRISTTALADSAEFTWDKRSGRIADIIMHRLKVTSPEPGRWSAAHTRVWRRQSWRWLINLLRTRSLVLPPYFGPDAVSDVKATMPTA